MSTTTEKTVADLVASINGKDVLSGWDVLVCYHEDDLNKLLQTRHDTIDKDANVSVIPQFKAEYKGKETLAITRPWTMNDGRRMTNDERRAIN
jgi:hypothetical protein